MLDLTYEVLARKKSSIKKQVNELQDSSAMREFEKKWNDRKIEPRDVCIGGGDGSINHKRYKNIVIYAANAAALIFDGKIRRCDSADIGVLYPYYQIEDRLHLYRAIFEFKTALKVIDEVDLFLVDGSLLSDLKALRVLETGLTKKARSEVITLLPEIEKSTGKGLMAVELREELGKEEFREKVGFLEYLEYLTCLEKLISKGLDKIVGISKLSTRSSLGKGVPDIAIFDDITINAGFSKPEQDFVSKKFPVYDEFFRSLVFTISNIRLEDKKDMFMMEIPREVDEEELVRIMEQIRSISVNGYPYLLKKAHKDVIIKNAEMERIITGLGILSKTGREVLR